MISRTPLHIVLDMDSTLLSMECLDSVIETALSAQLHPDAIAVAMEEVNREMDKGMAGVAPLTETIPARIAIAKRVGAPVMKAHFELVAQMVPSTLTPGIIDALQHLLAHEHYESTISVVSGGPQICVDAATQALERSLKPLAQGEVSITGVGNQIEIDAEGSFDAQASKINNSKKQVVQALVEDPALAIMAGDGSTDVEVFDAGVTGFFVAVGVWVQRSVLFERPENRPYFIKAHNNAQIADAFRMAAKAVRGQ